MADSSTLESQHLQHRHTRSSSSERKAQVHARRSSLRALIPAQARSRPKAAFLALGLALVLLYSFSTYSSDASSDDSSRISLVALEASPAGAPPTFFNLEVPERLRLDLQRCAAYCSGATDPLDPADAQLPTSTTFREDIQKAYGGNFPVEELDKYPKDIPYTLHATDQFALSGIINLRVNHLVALTPIPTTTRPTPGLDFADFLLLSLDTLLFPRKCTSYCGHHKNVPASLNRNDLNRDVEGWLRDTVAMHGKRRSYPSLILSLSRIGRDYDTSFLRPELLEDLKDDVIFLGIERESGETKDPMKTFEQMPYPSIFSLPLSKMQGVDGPAFRNHLETWLLSQSRPYLVSFAGKAPELPENGIEVPFSGFAVRRQLASTLALYPNDSSISVLIPSWATRGHAFVTLTHQVMLHARFCLQPPGDSATRKGYWESILLGCIPVVFRRGTYAKVWRDLGVEWDQVALFIDEKEFLEKGSDIVEILKGVKEEDVRSRQRDIAKLAWRVQYAIPSDGFDQGWSNDAFGMLLRRLDRIKRGGDDEGRE
ncbi:hypothetical protein RQP46_002222 [Phenoliferia psychrophenolica]